MRGKSIPWSQEEDDRLRRLIEDGKRVAVIAELLKRTEGAVYRRASSLGLTFKRLSKRATAPPDGPTEGGSGSIGPSAGGASGASTDK